LKTNYLDLKKGRHSLSSIDELSTYCSRIVPYLFCYIVDNKAATCMST